jgi:hypothetical protein
MRSKKIARALLDGSALCAQDAGDQKTAECEKNPYTEMAGLIAAAQHAML